MAAGEWGGARQKNLGAKTQNLERNGAHSEKEVRAGLGRWLALACMKLWTPCTEELAGSPWKVLFK